MEKALRHASIFPNASYANMPSRRDLTPIWLDYMTMNRLNRTRIMILSDLAMMKRISTIIQILTVS